ncbi:autotransporter domain-containing protein, partial [Psychrilyobacter sp. S5]
GYTDTDETAAGTDPLDGSAVPADYDGDKVSDATDPDDDNDGVLDEEDAFPKDKNESVDTDGDGIGNNADTDDDGDGIPDEDEQLDGSLIDPEIPPLAQEGGSGELTIDGGAVGIKTESSSNIKNTSNYAYSNYIVKDKVGMLATHENGQVINSGTITIDGDFAGVYGMVAQLGGTVRNKGTINLNGEYNVGMKAIGGSLNDDTTDEYGEGGTVIMDSGSYIYINGNNNVAMQAVSGGYAESDWDTYIKTGENNRVMQASGEGSVAVNNDYIHIEAAKNMGMQALNGGKIQNIQDGDYNSMILIQTSNIIGMQVDGSGSIGESDGSIELGVYSNNSSNSIGMNAINGGKIYNKKSTDYNDTSAITSMGSGTNIIGMHGTGSGAEAYNSSKITMATEASYAIKMENGAYGENTGQITISSADSYGMYAGTGSTVVNKEGGTITVNGSNSTGMVADGSGAEAYNYGTIHVKSESGTTNSAYTAKDESSQAAVDTVYMKAINGGQIYQLGTLQSESSIVLSSDSSRMAVPSSYLFSSADASYDAGGDFTLDGEMHVFTLAGMGNEYTVNNYIVAEGNIEGEEGILSLSPVYKIAASVDEGNDGSNRAALTFTKINDIENLVTEDWMKPLAELIDGAVFNNTGGFVDKYPNLAAKIANTTSYTPLMEELSANEYANISKLILDNEEFFNGMGKKVMHETRNSISFKMDDSEDSIDKYKIVLADFVEFGERQLKFAADYKESSTKEETGTVGYESNKGGFILALENEKKGITLGYSKEDVDYNEGSEGDINSIHLGGYSSRELGSAYLNTSLGFEYNMHDMERRIDVSGSGISEKAEANFNSYTVSLENRISRSVELNTVSVSPYVSLNLAMGYHEDIEESGAPGLNAEVSDETVYSTELEGGIILSKKFSLVSGVNLKLYTHPRIKYDFAHPEDVREEVSLEGINGSYSLSKAQEREDVVGIIEVGASLELFNNLYLKGSFIIDSEQDDYTSVEVEYKF